MRFLVDECCDAGLARRLRKDGHDVVAVVENHRGAPDAAVLRLAVAEGRILVTEDKDFGDHAFRQGAASQGIVLLRMNPREREAKTERVAKVVKQFGHHLVGGYTVVLKDRYRFRRLPSPT